MRGLAPCSRPMLGPIGRRFGAFVPPATVVSIGASQSAGEGNSGATVLTFPVTRSGVTTGASSVQWAVSGTGANPAIADDFTGGVLPSGSVSFAAGETAKTISISIAGDTVFEPDESFLVGLFGAAGCAIGTGTSLGTIVNDDAGGGGGGGGEAPSFPGTLNAALPVFSIEPETTTNPTTFIIGDLAGSAANDVLWIEAATDDGYTGNLSRHYHQITDAELAAYVQGSTIEFLFTPPLSALTDGTRRYRPVLARGNERSNAGTSRTVGPNDIAPVLSALSISGVGSGAATVNVTTNYPAGTLHTLLTVANTAPTTAEIAAGASQAITSAGAKTQGVTGVSGTTRYAWVMHRPDVGPDSAITSAGTINFAAGSTAVLSSADENDGDNSPDKSVNVAVSGGGLIATTIANQGAACLVRSTDAPPTKSHFEMICQFAGTNATGLYIGMSDKGMSLAGSARPGEGGNLGFILECYPTGTEAYLLKEGGYITITLPSAMANGDALVCEYDSAAKAVLMKRRRSSTEITLWSGTLVSNLPVNPRATVGGRWSNDIGTVNFGASTFASTPTSGYAGW